MRRLRKITKEKRGDAMIVVMAILAVMVVLGVTLLLSASMVLGTAKKNVTGERLKIMASSFSEVIEKELTSTGSSEIKEYVKNALDDNWPAYDPAAETQADKVNKEIEVTQNNQSFGKQLDGFDVAVEMYHFKKSGQEKLVVTTTTSKGDNKYKLAVTYISENDGNTWEKEGVK
ncbi:hypothetical protein [Ohessyouella blattaphilus]|uniref:Uncharacterized protein n=1 Tax=Ohessyouella blattaphilus TaxID=2949333 RepID=A0ABT1ENU8_9FIRM|nr:hypothetical protein [Ohessyouella blattaphilus]MCP1110957.1 hypothetical protein [Ohessyouella blattaphilus]MCR8564351.1 hypothetical protein [Ohessyouella blattaphilus]